MTRTCTGRQALWLDFPPAPRRRRARGLWLVLAAALLALCHGCHGEDVDDELFGGGWWVAGGV